MAAMSIGLRHARAARIVVHFALIALAAAILRPAVAEDARRESCMGFFAPWAKHADGSDAGGREASLRAREKELGLPPSSLLALDYYGADSWEEMKAYRWIPPFWTKLNPNRRLVWSVALTMKGVPLAAIAAGAHDADFAEAAATIAAAQPAAVIRIGWEMNGDWFAWASKGVEADYVAAFRRVVRIFRAASSRFTFAWTPGAGALAGSPEQAYPGDDVVDTIGLDLYDIPSDKPPAEAWDAAYSGPFGLAWLERFAARHGKPMHLGEWGAGLLNAPDNPLFIEKVHDWLSGHARALAFHIYFDAATSDLDSAALARSRARFYALFSRRPSERRTGNCER